MGWLLLALGLSVSASGPAEAYTNYGVARAGAVPAAELVAVYLPATVVTAIACLGFLLLLTPTGALPSAPMALVGQGHRGHAGRLAAGRHPRTQARWSARPGGRQPLDLHGLHGVPLAATQAAFAVTNVAFVVAAASLVVRFRRARGTERQQLRWVALATVVLALLSVVVLAA